MFHDLFVKTIVSYIENHIKEAICVEQIAAIVGYEENYFREVFRNSTGMSISRYIKLRKLSHAAFDLKNSSASIIDIALASGFNSHDVFIRAFKRAFGSTPSEFRKSSFLVKGAPIVPGVFVPTVIKEEDFNMNKVGQEKDQNGVILYGVPKVSYFKREEIELTPFISSLRACLTYMGQDISYARLMVGSGAAFRLMWNTEYWDGGNVDILCMSENPFEPLQRAYETAGREYTLLPKAKDLSNKEECIKLIKNEIDNGKPLIGFGIIGPPEACVITGYRDNGETLLGWNFFQDMPEWSGSFQTEPCGYYIRNGWYEHSETVALMAVGKEVEALDEKIFLRKALQNALNIMETPKVGKRAAGFAAYKAWAKAILDDNNFSGNLSLPILFERLMCQCDAFTMISEGRAYAGWFMKEEAEKFPELRFKLLEISDIFKREHETAWEMVKFHEGLQMGEYQAKALAETKNRKEIVKLINQAEALDREAAEQIKSVLNML